MLFHTLSSLTTVLIASSLFGTTDGDSSVLVADYGVDCTFPIHSKELKCGARFGDDREQVYEHYMQGCRDHYSGKKAIRCDTTEYERIEMSLRQPQSMVNYTSTGFTKTRAPEQLMAMLTGYWERNRKEMKEEDWPAGNIYVNHWESPTYMVSIEDSSLEGGGFELKNKVWDSVKPVIEEWTNMELKPSSQYGIRVYTRGAILSPHVDRLPLVSSCIINVAQDVEEPWVLEVIDRQGRAVNVTMNPGDMVLYESGSLIHSRPFALKGEYFANIFVHFEPTGRPLGDTTDDYLETLDDFFPPYLLKDSPEAAYWANSHPHGWRKPSPSAPIQDSNSPAAHHAAATGDIEQLRDISRKNKKALQHRDDNGWEPIHEAVRGGHSAAVEFLVKEGGVNINTRTGRYGNGVSPLHLALEFLEPSDSIITFLLSSGAEDYKEFQEEL
ncbi:hypothetical protein ACA910_019956 [Epithemia clementina (nom. ined.)]